MGGAKPAPIEFKNPFFDAKEFIVRIDNPSFTTSVKSPVKVEVQYSIFNHISTLIYILKVKNSRIFR